MMSESAVDRVASTVADIVESDDRTDVAYGTIQLTYDIIVLIAQLIFVVVAVMCAWWAYCKCPDLRHGAPRRVVWWSTMIVVFSVLLRLISWSCDVAVLMGINSSLSVNEHGNTDMFAMIMVVVVALYAFTPFPDRKNCDEVK